LVDGWLRSSAHNVVIACAKDDGTIVVRATNGLRATALTKSEADEALEREFAKFIDAEEKTHPDNPIPDLPPETRPSGIEQWVES
jgi:hypothetical protein